jgi:hypothetical protein
MSNLKVIKPTVPKGPVADKTACRRPLLEWAHFPMGLHLLKQLHIEPKRCNHFIPSNRMPLKRTGNQSAVTTFAIALPNNPSF